MTTRTEPRPAAAHVPPTPPPPAPAGMALTELLAALEGERRTHAAAVRAGSTRQEATMREPTMREPDAHAGASELTAVYIDPLVGAALVHLGLRILPGIPCPTCRGTGWRCRNSNLMCTHRVHQGCEDCTGSGVWTPPDHPVTIGVTSATADAMLDQDERMHEAGYDIGIISDQRSGWELATRPPGEEWTSGNTIKHPIVLSSVIGEGTLRKLKVITDDDIRPAEGSYIIHDGYGRLTLWPEFIDISSALPFLPGLKPEDTVYLLDGFTESVECPEWHDSTPEDVINEVERRLRDEEWSSQASDRCRTALLHIDAYREGKARSQSVGRLSCPFPVDAPDQPTICPEHQYSEPQDQR